MSAPLPAVAAGPARSYLEAMLPEGEVGDAWHELHEDVAYWGDRDLAAVLHLAHEIVRQRARVSDEAAALSLLDDAGIDDPDVVARTLGVDVDRADDLLARAREALGHDVFHEPHRAPEDEAPAASPVDPAPAPAPVEDVPPTEAPTAEVTDEPSRFSRPEVPATATSRITFDDTSEPAVTSTPPSSPITPASDRSSGGPPRTRILLAWAALIWAVILVAWLLGAFD